MTSRLSIICPVCEEQVPRGWKWCRICGTSVLSILRHPDLEKHNPKGEPQCP